MQINHSIDHLLPPHFKNWNDTDQLIWEAAQQYFPDNDSSGVPYNLHLFRVGQRAYDLVMHVENNPQKARQARQVGLTHDFCEDIKKFRDDPHELVKIGLNEELTPSVLSVTHNLVKETYAEAMVRAKADPLGRYVKLSDLTDNSLLARFPIGGKKIKFLTPISKATNRHMKYFLSYLYLCDTLGQDEYFSQVTPYLK